MNIHKFRLFVDFVLFVVVRCSSLPHDIGFVPLLEKEMERRFHSLCGWATAPVAGEGGRRKRSVNEEEDNS